MRDIVFLNQKNENEGAKMIGTSRAGEILGCKRDKVSAMCRNGVFKTAEQDGAYKSWRIEEWEVIEYAKKKGKKKK